MRTYREHLFDIALPESFNIRLGELREEQIVAETPRRIAIAALLAKRAECYAEMPQHGYERKDDLTSLWIVSAHAAQPQAILLRAVVDRKLALLQESLPLARGEAHRIAVALQIEEQLSAILVLPFARVHGAAPQSDDDRKMLDPDRTLVFARPTSCALEGRFFGNVFRQQRLGCVRPVLVQIVAYSERDLLRIEDLSRVVRRAVLRTAPALDARIGLQRYKLGDVLARVESEIFVTGQRWNLAESVSLEKNRHRTQNQVQVLGMRDERQENQKRQRVGPPIHPAGGAALLDGEGQKVRHHQDEDE